MTFHSFLLVDIGNTRLKWAVSDRSKGLSATYKPVAAGEMATAEVTPDRIRALRESFPGHYLVLASVVPKLVPLFTRTFKRGFHLVNAESDALGLRFDYPHPAEIGADRLAAAVAVHVDGHWPVIVVSCGTATAFTVLDAKGQFCGGAIAPGLQAQLDSILGTTAQLPATTLRAPRHALARSTKEAIRAGVIFNFQGGVKEILRKLTAELSGRPQIVLTGGSADYLAESLDLPHTLRPLLVFEGLRIIGIRAFKDV